MFFKSSDFALFFISVFLLYYSPIMQGKQIWFLVLVSLLFYGWMQPCWLLLLMLSICGNALVSWRMAVTENTGRYLWMAVCITLNLLLLAAFKYANLASVALTKVDYFSPALIGALSTVVLPIGISFYTFEAISLLVDSKRKLAAVDARPLHHIRDTALFFAFFPHLAAGPIVRPRQFYTQICHKAFTDIDWRCVIESLIVGYFLKNVVADNLSPHTNAVLNAYRAVTGINSIFALIGASVRLFADFAGYSLIAIGLAAALGYKLPVNFNFPYISQSFAEFWTRWHITLSTWIRDYLYVPLGGSRRGRVRTYCNLLVAMFLAGLWHGGKVGFAVWGLYHGICLCLERALGLADKQASSFAGQLFRAFIIFILVTIGFSLFALPLHEVKPYFASVVEHWQWQPDQQHIFLVSLFSAPVLVWHCNYLARAHGLSLSMPSAGKLREFFLACMLFLLVTNSGTAQEFLYFQF